MFGPYDSITEKTITIFWEIYKILSQNTKVQIRLENLQKIRGFEL